MPTKPTAQWDMNTQKTTHTADGTAENVAPAVRQGGASSKSVWSCDRCGYRLTLFVKPTVAPTHLCHKAVNKTKQLIKEVDYE